MAIGKHSERTRGGWTQARKAWWSKFEFASFPIQPSPRAELWSECAIIRQAKNADLFEVIAFYLLVYCFSNIPFLPINGLFILFGSLYSLSEDESWENWMAATLLWLWSVIFLWGVSLLGWIYCVFAMVHSKRGPFFRTVCLYTSLPRPSAAIFHVGYIASEPTEIFTSPPYYYKQGCWFFSAAHNL